VSEYTAEAAQPGVPHDVELASLGRYRLRDFDAPVAMLQASAVGRPSAFPAVRAVPADHHNIVRPATSFVGRQRELAAIEAAGGPGRLVTLVGAGGIGKTRVATEVGPCLADPWARRRVDGASVICRRRRASRPFHPGCARTGACGTARSRWPPATDDQLLSDKMLARTADRLGAERYAAERAVGGALTVDQALAMADSVLSRAAS
jgi:hypothetical protein